MDKAHHLFLLISIGFIQFSASAQQWVEEGMNIRFEKTIFGGGWSGDTQGCVEWIYTGDSLIAGDSYQILEGTYRHFMLNFDGDTISQGMDELPSIYLTSNGDSTWFFKNEEKHLLANFNAQVGDQWTTPIEPTYWLEQSWEMVFTLDSVGLTDLTGEDRPVMYYHYAFEVDGANCTEMGTGKVIKGLFHKFNGGEEYILPIATEQTCLVDVVDLYLFSSVSSDESQRYSEFASNPSLCDDMDVGIMEQVRTQTLLFPNPAQDYFSIRNTAHLNIQEVQIRDLSGKLQKRVLANDRIELSGLEPGMYLVQVYMANGIFHSEKLIIE
jgi:hypothetical protein